MCVGEYTNYPEELMLFNALFKFYAPFCVRNHIFCDFRCKRINSRIEINIQKPLVVSWFIGKTVNCEPTTVNGYNHVFVRFNSSAHLT